MRRIERYMRHPHRTQEAIRRQLIQATKHTEWGRKHGFRYVKTAEQFAAAMPVNDYDALKPYIARMMRGEKDVLWSGAVRWYSKSSGTTSDKSKFIPISNQNLKQNHKRGGWDTVTLMYHQRPDALQFGGKSLLMGGSMQPYEPYPKSIVGDVSAFLMHHMPSVTKPFVTPDFETALHPDFAEKIDRMADIISRERDLVSLGGVPTWIVVLFRKIMERTGVENLLELWPNLQSYIHGGVSFQPYEQQFREVYLPSDNITYQEVYNASEGFFAAQSELTTKDMLLFLDNGVYYEFIPSGAWHQENPNTLQLHEVRPGENYALVISTNGGLWRYTPGDTITFTSTNPYKIRITGRTKHFINAFGEEVMVENTDRAVARTCRVTGAVVSEYTVAPIYFGDGNKGGHQWLVEFETPPADIRKFSLLLDENLQRINSDYEAKRFNDMALLPLTLRPLPPGTLLNWLRSKGKFGSQAKVPRLANHRQHVEEILAFVKKDLHPL